MTTRNRILILKLEYDYEHEKIPRLMQHWAASCGLQVALLFEALELEADDHEAQEVEQSAAE